jgi:adenine-specific DNA-methyltransferase
LDFFAGSGTLGHAVWAQNIEDGVRRRFILVQAPEPVEADGNAARLGYHIIPEILRARLDRASAALEEEGNGEIDKGYRYFKVAETALAGWQPPAVLDRPEDYVGAAVIFGETPHAVDENRARELVWEILLKGTDRELTADISPLLAGDLAQAFEVAEEAGMRPRVVVVLDERISDDALRALALGADDALICFSSALTDTQAANLAINARLLLIERIPGAVSV